MAKKRSLEIQFNGRDRVSTTVGRIEKRFDRFNQNVKRMAIGLAVAFATRALAREVREVVSVFAEFEKSLSRVRAVSGATNSEMARMTTLAAEMGRTTAFTASQAADAMGEFALRGFDAGEIARALPHALNLAAAGELDLAQAADIASGVLRGFNLTADQTGRVADVLAKASATSATNVSMLGDAMADVGPIAQSANQSLEQTIAVMQVLSDNMLGGAKGGTAFRNILLRMQTGVEGVQTELDRLDVTVSDSNGRFRDFADIVEDLDKAMRGMTQTQRSTTLNTLAGTRATAAMEVIMREGANAIRERTAALDAANDSAKDMAEIRLDNLAGDFVKLGSAVEGLRLGIMQGETGKGMRWWVQRVTEGYQDWATILTPFNSQLDIHRERIREIGEEMKALDEGFLRDTPRGQFNRKTRLPELEAERDVLLGIVRAERLVARANEASAQRRTRIAELEQLPTMMDNLQTRARNLGRAVSDGFTSGFQFISEEVDKALKPFRDRAESIFQITRTAGEMFAQDMEELKKLTGLGLIDRDTVKRATKMYQEELDRPMADRAARILEQTRTPLERIKKEIEDVMELFREGFINESAMGRAMAMFKDQLKSTFEQSPIRVQATLPGLSDSRFLTGATQQSQEKLLARQTMNLQKRQTDEAVKANGLLQQIREALTSGEPLILGAELGR